jgi:predicted RNase H-like nuclease (RuvC/YqgF family)
MLDSLDLKDLIREQRLELRTLREEREELRRQVEENESIAKEIKQKLTISTSIHSATVMVPETTSSFDEKLLEIDAKLGTIIYTVTYWSLNNECLMGYRD